MKQVVGFYITDYYIALLFQMKLVWLDTTLRNNRVKIAKINKNEYF